MEGPETWDRQFTNSLLFMQEARRRGYDVFYYTHESLSLSHEGISASVSAVGIDLDKDDFFEIGACEKADLSNFDVVFMRQHPPVDMNYITMTYILEQLQGKGVFVTNDPAAIRNTPEKLTIFQFPDFIPPTLVSRYKGEIQAFFKAHQDLIVKPLYSYYGYGIQRASAFSEIEEMLEQSAEPLMFQKFLPDVEEGNMRIALFDGEIIASKNSIPAKGTFNTHEGYKDVEREITPREKEICRAVGKMAKDRGLHFVGLDLIGGYLTEINATCPGSFQEIYHMKGDRAARYEAKLWDVIERRRLEFLAAR